MTMHASYAGGALLAVDGELPPAELILELWHQHTIVVAADGAGSKLFKIALVPHVVIGDLDSVGEGMRARLADEGVEVIHLESQEENDLEKSLLWLIDQGYESVTVIGAGGGMTDHALNNFSVLAKLARRLRISVRDVLSIGYLLPDAIRIEAAPGERISLIPLPSARLTTTGLAWELRSELLAIGVREGASNRAAGEYVEITVEEGLVLVMHYPGFTA
jgi:thiamine pyrophosphokinase